MPLLRAAARGLRAGDPSAEIVFGAPAQVDDGFIERLLPAGRQPYFDIMAVHPYQGEPDQAAGVDGHPGRSRMTHFPALIEVMAAHGDQGKPVWWTEFGFSVHSNLERRPGDQLAARPARRQHVRRLPAPLVRAGRTRYPQVRVAVVYTAYSTEDSRYGHKEGYRLLRERRAADARSSAMLSSYMARFAGHRPLT